MTEPVVDVGIPTHGQPRYLREAVESVLGQTFESWRLTISVNGPGGAAIKASLEPHLSDQRVQLVETGAELSAPQNATRAIQTGHAPYVALLHDDDRWAPDFLARRVSFFESHETCGLVFSNCNYIDGAGDTMGRYDVDLSEGLQPRDTFLLGLYRHNVIAMPTILCRRLAYETVGPVFNDSLQFDDYEMWLRIAARFDVGFLDVWDAEYRIHSAQRTHDVLRHMGGQRLELLAAVDRWLPHDFPTIDRRRARAGAYFRSSYDALARREWRRAASDFARALQTYPVAVFDPKMAVLAYGSLRFRARQRSLWKSAMESRVR
jgi:glycosyltransferase involved in cell wall biosynthesis